MSRVDRVLLMAVIALQVGLIVVRLRSGSKDESYRNADVTHARQTVATTDPIRRRAPLSPPSGWAARVRHVVSRPEPGLDAMAEMLYGWDRLERSPGLDVIENANGFAIYLSLPSVPFEQGAVRMDNGILSIQLTLTAEDEESDDPNTVHGQMIRRLQLPGVRSGNWTPESAITNGLLRIWIPKG